MYAEAYNFKYAFISDVCHRCLCVISEKTEMAKEKEYLRQDFTLLFIKHVSML